MFSTATLLGLAGLLLVIVTTTVWFKRASQVAIPDNRLAFLLGWAGAGVLGLASLGGPGTNWLSYFLGGLSAIGGVFFLGLYTLRKQNAANPIMVGDRVPMFEALDDQARTYNSDALIGTPTLFKFFRGHW